MRKYRSAKELAKLAKRGRYAAGPNLYLQISEWGTRSWIFRYRLAGRHRHMGLGPVDLLTLDEARERAHEARRQLKLDGVDPLEAKRGIKREQLRAAARSLTFKQVALQFISAHEDSWRGDGSRRQWLESLNRHAFPKIGDMPIGDVDVTSVLAVLDPMSATRETQHRVRNRLAAILDWAHSRDLRDNNNPARRPHLLPKRKKEREHFVAMAYPAVPKFMQELREQQELSARGLELLILCASRPGEILDARWSDIDLSTATWTVPGERMKSGRLHRVPLSSRAVELLADLPREGEYVLPGARTGARAHPMTLVRLLRRMGHPNLTAHGFRASFKTWASERTNFPRELIEAALAHVVGDEAEQSYLRADMLARRRQLMESWAEYLSKPDTANGVVVPLRQGAPA